MGDEQAEQRRASTGGQHSAVEEGGCASPERWRPFRRWTGWLVLVLAGLLWQQWPQLSGLWSGKRATGEESAKGGKGDWRGKGGPIPVLTTRASMGPIRVQLEALGTVTPAQLVVVKSRVDGPLLRVAFQEGAMVEAGQLLAEIDPKPFLIQLEQAKGQLLRDQAQLENARRDASRYRTLLKDDSVSRQQAETQQSLVQQYLGTVQVDQAQVESAQLQLSYTRISAPLAGMVGLRQVDPGNMIRQSDNNGLVSIAQVRPIQVLFTLAEDQLPRLLPYWQAGTALAVTLYDRERKNRLAEGKLLTLDNQIDSSTGTIKLKAEFANADGRLFPNQFVNVSLTLEERPQAVLIPAAAVQRSRKGSFVYRVKEDQTVSQQMVTLGPSQGELTAIEEGLQAGEKVVLEGVDKLREGSKIQEPAQEGGERGSHDKRGQPARGQ
ncbi:MAG: MdtA/MuxA family multidrug efflux RND transporter periplasmic adaptor subunit [Magnetococcales bacterium]|nr:MdtA/MuxA family multidrug efflux RND transporter periplasmic adaptor subunit [Magnetococcales bacterium]MBF0115965.1 MdtA/MuxA family multidrug efflux RND transporter periplasmic adaptor subunit [Magnetococcales bacterium]